MAGRRYFSMDEETEDPTLTVSNPELIEFDIHLRRILNINHPRIMNLELKIPPEYPWEELLQKHFAQPPFELTREDYETIIVGKTKLLKIRETRKHTTFFSLLRFLEFFRNRLEMLELNLSRIENQHEKLRKTATEKTGIRGLLRAKWNYDSIANKHIVIQNALNQKTGLENVLKKLETILAQNHNVTSKWQYLIEPFYRKVINYMNANMSGGSFNLRMFVPVKTMEENLAPHYADSMLLAIELDDAVIQTTQFLKRYKSM